MTELQRIQINTVTNISGIIRLAYIETINYLHSLSEHFRLIEEGVNRLDADQAWPRSHMLNYNGNPITVDGILDYKGIPLHINIDQNGVLFIKFPVVEHDINVINTYGYYTTAHAWERPYLTQAERTPPTVDQLFNESGQMIYRKTRIECAKFTVSVQRTPESILTEVETKYRKYINSVKKSKTSLIDSRKTVYNHYIKNRWSPLSLK